MKLKLTLATLALVAVTMVPNKVKIAAGPHTQRPPPCPPCIAARGEPLPLSRTE